MDVRQITEANNRLANQMSGVADDMKKAIDENDSPAPYLSVDPKTQTPAVVGDPNEIPTGAPDYSLTFMYPAEVLSEDDKAKMAKIEEINHYQAVVRYQNKRIKPLYRGKIISLLTKLLTAVEVVRGEGYTSDLDTLALGKALLEHPEDMAEIARIVLDVPESQLEYISPKSLSIFVTQLIHNEKNILKESHNFLA